jgi:hypothetical protein
MHDKPESICRNVTVVAGLIGVIVVDTVDRSSRTGAGEYDSAAWLHDVEGVLYDESPVRCVLEKLAAQHQVDRLIRSPRRGVGYYIYVISVNRVHAEICGPGEEVTDPVT